MREAKEIIPTVHTGLPSPLPSSVRDKARNGLRVLIADANAGSRNVLRELLERAGLRVIEAKNGIAALKQLEQDQFDAVISEIHMPEMDGFRLCSEVRKNPKLRTLPFIIYAASGASPAEENIVLQYGADRFIRKPTSEQNLIDCIDEVVASAKCRDRGNLEIAADANLMREYSQALVKRLELTHAELSSANAALEERARLAECASAVTTALVYAANLPDMLRNCTDALVKHLSIGIARIWTVDREQNVLELCATSGEYADLHQDHSRIPFGWSEIGRIAAQREAYWTNEMVGDPRIECQEWAHREGLIAFAGNPLIVADQLVGVVAVFARNPLSQNTLEHLCSVGQNIAVGIQRQLAEAELRDSEERFRELAENINEIFFIADPEGGPVHYVSPAYEEVTGQKRAVLYQNSHAWMENIHPEDRPRVEQAFRHQSDSLDQEYRIVRPDGAVRWLRTRAFPVKDETGAVVRVVGIAADITEQKRSEERVQQNLNRIRALHEIDLAITSTLDLPTILQILLEKIDVFFRYPTATTVRLFNPRSGDLELLACHNVDREEWENSFRAALGKRARRVLDTRKPVIVRNVVTDPDTVSVSLYRSTGLVSYIGVPLIAKDEIVGVLNLYTREEHDFSAEEIEFLMTLGGEAAIAIHNAQLFEEARKRESELHDTNRMLAALHAVGAVTSQSLDIQQILHSTIEKIREIFSFDATQIHTYDPEKDELVMRASFENDPGRFSSARSFKKGQGIVGTVAQTGESFICEDVQADPRYQQLSRSKVSGKFGYHFMAVFPIKSHQQVLGTLVCIANDARKLSSAETQLLDAITVQIAMALEHSSLYQDLREKVLELQQVNTAMQETNRMLSALYAIAAAASQTLDLDRVLQAALGKIKEIFDFDASRIHLLDADSNQLVWRASYDKDFNRTTPATPFRLGEGIIGKVAQTGQAAVFEDIEADPSYRQLSQGKFSGKFEDRFIAVFAIRSRSGILGTLTCLAHEARKLGSAEVGLIEGITEQVAVAVENARLFEKNELSKKELEATNRFLDKSLKQLGGLYTAMMPLALSESLDGIVNGIIARLIETTGADAALVRLWDKNAGDFPVIGQMGYSQDFIDQARPERKEGAVGWVISHGDAIIAHDIASDTRMRRKAQLELGFKSCAILPLRVHDEVRGVIQISSRTIGYFDEEQKDHLMAVARQMSIALENRELFYNLQTSRNQLERANKVKEEFLSVMSHELRTPLSVVIGYSGMLRAGQLGPLTKDQEKPLEIIQRNSNELIEMIDSLMDATKIEAGSMIAEWTRVSPASLLAEIKLSYDFPNRKNIGFEWIYPQTLPTLWTDLRKLRQILTNLINNALKFTDEGRIVISAEEKVDEGRKWIEFRVTDSGIGIAPEECDKIFERFHQVDGSGTRSFQGVGLGLHIVKSFTGILGGRVSVASEVGKGSTFTVRLPVEKPS